MIEPFCEDVIIQNLKDAGCDEMTISRFVAYSQAGKQANASQVLQAHRQELLNKLHQEQKRIDCLDYLIFMLNRSTENHISI